ncbi:MAG: Hsp20 family protein [Paracoccaceae bacterium]|nr:Hsp20 family protein [Paracoccaceae bacterium]
MTFISTPNFRSFVGFDSLFDELEKVSNFKENSYPAYNIEKTGDLSYEITIALAGFKESQLSIEVEQSVLTISTVNEESLENRNYLHKGIATRAFTKQFRLAENVEVDNASFENGLLIVKLHKNIPEADLPRKIEINAKPKKIATRAA